MTAEDTEATATCEFFGGPSHGQSFEVQDNIREVKIAQPLLPAHDEAVGAGELASIRYVRYTRVFNSKTPTNQFEYVGKAL